MSRKFNINDILSEASRGVAVDGENKILFPSRNATITKLSVRDLIPSEENFYSMNDIEELKSKIELVGSVLQNLIVVNLNDGKYKVISGHRRRLASMLLVEEGKTEYEFIPCAIEESESDAETQMLKEEIILIAANSQREKTTWDKIEEAKRMRSLIERAKSEEQFPGSVRDYVARVLKTSPAQIGRYDAIIKNLSPAFKEELKADKINVSTAYEISGLPEDEQNAAFNEYTDNGGSISIKEAKAKKTEQPAPPLHDIEAPPGDAKEIDVIITEETSPTKNTEEPLTAEIPTAKKDSVKEFPDPAKIKNQLTAETLLLYSQLRDLFDLLSARTNIAGESEYWGKHIKGLGTALELILKNNTL